MKPMMKCRFHGEVYPTDEYLCPHCSGPLTDDYRHGPVNPSTSIPINGAIELTADDYQGRPFKMKIDDAMWEPKGRRGATSNTARALTDMMPGEVKRIYHDDLTCHYGKRQADRRCTISGILHQLRKQGWEIEYYHEAQYIAVVRRVK